MYTILIKLLKDCRLSIGKVLLMILASGLASWGVSSVIYSYAMSERDFRENFARTYPADIEMVVDDYPDGLANTLLSDSSVTTIERREVLGGRIRNAAGQWMPLVLFAVEDLPTMKLDVFRVLDTIDNQASKILIETNARSFLDPSRDSIRVQIPGTDEISWEVGGTSHDPRLAPARMERVVFAHATSLAVVAPYLKQGRRRLLIETNAAEDLKSLQDIADRLRLTVSKQGGKVVLLSIPTPGEHIHQNIVDGIAFLQVSAGVLLAIMGVILLSLILLTWVLPKIRDIGIMKALGASTSTIFYSYLAILTFIVCIGLAIGVPLGYTTALRYNGAVAFIQNFEPVADLLPLSLHLLVFAISLTIPLFFAILPISGAARMTVNEAVNKTFHVRDRSLISVSQNLSKGIQLRYSLNNLFRNSPRTLLTIFLIAVGTGLFFTGANLEYSVRTELARFAANTTYGVRVRLNQEMTMEDIAFLHQLPFVEDLRPMKDRPATYRPPFEPFTETRSIRYVASDHFIGEEFILKGHLDPQCKSCIYVCGEGLRQKFENFELGQTIDLTLASGETQSYTYSGIFKDMAAIGAPFFVFDDDEVDSFNALAIQIKRGSPYSNVMNGIDDALLENGIDMAGMLHVDMRMGQLQGHLEPTYFIIKVTGMLTILLGLIGLLIVLNLSIQERTRELGIVKALGGTAHQIASLFLREFLLITFLAIALGVLVALPLTSALCKIMSETVIYHRILPGIDLRLLGWTSLTVALGQMGLILVFSRIKIGKEARKLMDHHF